MKLRTVAVVGLLLALLGGTIALGTTGAARPAASVASTSTTPSTPTTRITTPRPIVPRYVPPPVTVPRQVLPIVPSLPRPIPTGSSAPTVAAAGPRPRSGAVVDARGSKGEGKAEVENGTSHDGLLTLAQNGRAVRSVYVRAGDEATLSGVRDGAYEVFFTTGSGWNADLRRFTSGPDYQRFPGTSDFTTTRTQYSVWSFSLQPVAGGDVTPQDVAADRYPS